MSDKKVELFIGVRVLVVCHHITWLRICDTVSVSNTSGPPSFGNSRNHAARSAAVFAFVVECGCGTWLWIRRIMIKKWSKAIKVITPRIFKTRPSRIQWQGRTPVRQYLRFGPFIFAAVVQGRCRFSLNQPALSWFVFYATIFLNSNISCRSSTQRRLIAFIFPANGAAMFWSKQERIRGSSFDVRIRTKIDRSKLQTISSNSPL